MSDIIEVFKRRISNFIEGKVQDLACDELGSLGTTFVRDMMDLAEQSIEGYLGDLSSEHTNPLHLEQNLKVSNDIVLLDLKDTENTIGSWFNQALHEVDALLGTEVTEAVGTSSTNRDLGVNTFLRKNFLDEDGSFTLEGDQIPFDRQLFQGQARTDLAQR